MITLNNSFLFVLSLLLRFASIQGLLKIQEVKTCSGGTAVLKIPVSTKGLRSFEWTKDGERIAPESHLQINPTTIAIFNVIPNDGGIYIANFLSDQETLQFIFKLIVADNSLTLLTPPKIIATEGSNITIKAKANHHGRSSWVFNDKLLDVNNKSNHFKFLNPRDFDLINGGVLFIQNIQMRHHGFYSMTFDVEGCEMTVVTEVKVLKAHDDSGRLTYHSILSEETPGIFKSKVGVIVILSAVVVVTACVSSLITVWCLGLCRVIKRFWQKKRVKHSSKEPLLSEYNQSEHFHNLQERLKESMEKKLSNFVTNNMLNEEGPSGSNKLHSSPLNIIEYSHGNDNYANDKAVRFGGDDHETFLPSRNYHEKVVKIHPPSSVPIKQKVQKDLIFNTIR